MQHLKVECFSYFSAIYSTSTLIAHSQLHDSSYQHNETHGWTETLLAISLNWSDSILLEKYEKKKTVLFLTWSVNKRQCSLDACWCEKLEIFHSIVIYNQQIHMNNIDEMNSLSSSSAFKHNNSHLMTFSLKVNCQGFAKKEEKKSRLLSSLLHSDVFKKLNGLHFRWFFIVFWGVCLSVFSLRRSKI